METIASNTYKKNYGGYDERLQDIIENKDTENSLYGEYWSIIDGALVIHFEDHTPDWVPDSKDLDENGYTRQYYKNKIKWFEENV